MRFVPKYGLISAVACALLTGCGGETSATPSTTSAAPGDPIPPEALAAAQAELDQVAQAELAEQQKTAPPSRGTRSRAGR